MPPTSDGPAERGGWQAVIEGQLAEWEKDPSVLEDEGIEPPTRETLQLAAQIARDLCAAGLPAPQRVSSTGDGGIVFTRQEGPLFSTIEVASDRSVELIVLKDYRVVSRRRLR